jgi:hypothetical protein
MEKTENARYLGDARARSMLNSMRFTLDLARLGLQRLESGRIKNATAYESHDDPLAGGPEQARPLGRAPPLLKP